MEEANLGEGKVVIDGRPDLWHNGGDNHETTAVVQGDSDHTPRESITPPTSTLVPQDPGTRFGPAGEDTTGHGGVRQPE